MSLFVETFGDTFNFWIKYFLKLLVYQLFFLLFFGLSFGIILLDIYLAVSNFGLGAPTLVLLAIGFLISLIFGFVQLGGYSLMIKRVFEDKKISILEIFEESLKKVHKIIAVVIIQSLPVAIPVLITLFLIFYIVYFQFLQPLSTFSKTTGRFVLPLVGMATTPYDNQNQQIPQFILQFYSLIITILSLIFIGVIVGFICFYFTARLWLAIPILMVENLGCVESLKKSWQMTKGKFWSIFITLFIINFIVAFVSQFVMWGSLLIVGSAANLMFLQKYYLLTNFAPFFGGVINLGQYIGFLINYLIFAPISAIVAPLYYYNVKLEKE